MPQLPFPSGGMIPRQVFSAASQRSLPGLPPVVNHGNLLGDPPVTPSFPPLWFPGITSQRSYLPSNPCLGVYF